MKPITTSKRNVHILITLARGPITHSELKDLCFRKDEKIDYKAFQGEAARHLEQVRDTDQCVSRQFIERKLEKLESRELLSSAEYFQITSQGMPVREKFYFLTETGFHHVTRSFGVDKCDVRYGKPLDLHLDHELNLSRILRKIYAEEECGQYQVLFAHADRALRSLFFKKSRGFSPKGMHFLDLRVRVMSRTGKTHEIPLELANKKDDPDFWKTKITNIAEPFFILARNESFVNVIAAWIQEIELSRDMYVADLQNFLTHGLAQTTWLKVSTGKVEQVWMNLQ